MTKTITQDENGQFKVKDVQANATISRNISASDLLQMLLNANVLKQKDIDDFAPNAAT